ncbi:MAG: alpha/beta hydrolase, partial [Clostridia bacterium]|nr:alpha/beta hydrolase [Clostridia bacterium]
MSDQVQGNKLAREKRIWITLAICIATILIATFFSSWIQTAGFTYTVEDIRNGTNKGTKTLTTSNDTKEVQKLDDAGNPVVGADGKPVMETVPDIQTKSYTVNGKIISGVLFRPKNAEDGSRPAVVFSHGLYNNREMQIQNAIEMVRRGYVVVIIDQHNHGHNTSGTSSFFDTTHLDAAKYCYNLPEVDKSRIGVSGHSMGGYSTTNVLSLDSQTAKNQKDANFKAGKAMGIVSAYLVQAAGAPTGALQSTNIIAAGLVKGNADEFFYGGSQLKEPTYVLQNRGTVTKYNFDDVDAQGNPVYYVKKGDEFVAATKYSKTGSYYKYTTSGNTYYYLQSKPAFKFTRGIDPTADDDWATVNGGIYGNGGQLIAQPADGKLASVANKGAALASSTQQIRAVYEAKETHPMNHCSTQTAAHVIDFFYNAFGVVDGYEFKAPTNQTWWLKEVFSGIGIIGLFALLLPVLDLLLQSKAFASLKGEPAEAPVLLTRPRKHVSYWLGGILTTIFGAISFHNLVAEENWYKAFHLDTILDNASAGFIYVNMGKMAAWGIMCAVFSLLVTGIIWIVNHVINMVKYGEDFAAHDERPFAGLEIRSWGNIVKTIVLAALLVLTFYGIVNLVWQTTTVQFQVWVFGPRVFDPIRIASMAKYIPFFAVYYVMMAAGAQGYRVKDLPEWATIAINVVFNVAGFMLIVWHANSYFINNGAMIHTSNNMHYIHAFPMIPSIAIATVMARRIYVRT